MKTDLPVPVHLNKKQVASAAAMLTRSFINNPMFTTLISDEAERADKMLSLFRFMLNYGLHYGEVYATSPNLEGVAVWLPSEKVKVSFWRGIRCGGITQVFKVGWRLLWKIEDAERYSQKIHEKSAPFRHWYLAILGVDPCFQGKGYAGALLNYRLAQADRENLPCYLETDSEKNAALYEHFGFKIVEEFEMPEYNYTFRAMLRMNTEYT